MVVVVAPDAADAVAATLRDSGETVFTLGEVVAGQGVSYSGALG